MEFLSERLCTFWTLDFGPIQVEGGLSSLSSVSIEYVRSGHHIETKHLCLK